jgi:Arc/MetJ family transcription regulator
MDQSGGRPWKCSVARTAFTGLFPEITTIWNAKYALKNVYNYWKSYTWKPIMRTNIVIDVKLISEAIKVTGAKSKKEAVELGLKSLIQLKKQEALRGLRGKLKWRDDLDRMRLDG